MVRAAMSLLSLWCGLYRLIVALVSVMRTEPVGTVPAVTVPVLGNTCRSVVMKGEEVVKVVWWTLQGLCGWILRLWW
jgi:hypothetical protein